MCTHGTLTVALLLSLFVGAAGNSLSPCEEGPQCNARSLLQLSSLKHKSQPHHAAADEAWSGADILPVQPPIGMQWAETKVPETADFQTTERPPAYREHSGHFSQEPQSQEGWAKARWPKPSLDFGESFFDPAPKPLAPILTAGASDVAGEEGIKKRSKEKLWDQPLHAPAAAVSVSALEDAVEKLTADSHLDAMVDDSAFSSGPSIKSEDFLRDASLDDFQHGVADSFLEVEEAHGSTESFLESDASLEANDRYNSQVASSILRSLEEEVSTKSAHPSRKKPVGGLSQRTSPKVKPMKNNRLSGSVPSPSVGWDADETPEEAPIDALEPLSDTGSADGTPEVRALASRGQRIWTPVVRAAQDAAGHVHNGFASFSKMIQGPGIIIMAAMMLASSGVALLAVGKTFHQEQPDGENAQASMKHLQHPKQPAAWFVRPSPPLRPNAGDKTPRSSEGLPGSDRPEPSRADQQTGIGSQISLLSAPSVTGSAPLGSAERSSQRSFTPYGEPLPASHYLCSGLVVPRKSECILAVPILDTVSSCNVIRDLAGQPALQVEVTAPRSGGSGLEQHPAVVLRTCQTDVPGMASALLAYCKIEYRAGGHRAYFYGTNGNLFATLIGKASAGQKMQYVLANSCGSIRLSIEGDFKQHAVNVWSESRLLFGDTSPNCSPAFDSNGQYWQLRVLANMDVCLLLAALLSAELLDNLR